MKCAQCQSYATAGSKYCFHHDPSPEMAARRKRAIRKRAATFKARKARQLKALKRDQRHRTFFTDAQCRILGREIGEVIAAKWRGEFRAVLVEVLREKAADERDD